MTAPEVPDWTRPVSVMGQDSEGNPVTVLLDSLGRLICVLYGAITLSGPIDVSQVDSTREIQGADGVTLHTIAVDSEGRIIALIKGMYGSTPTNVAVDSSGQMITVPRGQSGNYLLVDSDGFMATLMKAIYAGTTLKTVACDEQGRMIMIPTDPADVWGNAISMGNAELAAVFSFAKQYDRRGNVVYVCGFENGILGWEQILSGTGAVVRHSTKQAKSGAFSCELVAGSTDSRYARIKRSFPFPLVKRFGYEFSFTLDPETQDILAYLNWWDGTNFRCWAVNYSLPNTTLSCGGVDGKHTTLKSNLNLYVRDTQFHTIKVVCDLENEIFARVLCDALPYTPTTASMAKSTSSENPRMELNIQHTSVTTPALNPNIWVDNIILTQMEPS